jgi:spermidine synthase
MDAYVKRSQIPPHLTTLEFYDLIKKRLSPDGIMVSNIYSGTELFDSHVATLKRAFNQVLFFKVRDSSKDSPSIIAVCADYSKPDLRTVLLNSKIGLLPDLRKYDVDLTDIKMSVLENNDRLINKNGQILTDDFAPVEFLETRKK